MTDPEDRGVWTGRSTATAPFNVEGLFEYLEGTWQFERTVHDGKMDREAECIGVAQFYAVADGHGDKMHYVEEGNLALGLIKTTLEREQILHFTAPSMAEVRSMDGRFLHLLDLTKGIVRVEHHSDDEIHHGLYRVLGPQAWLAVWRIIGPHKSQVITTRYLRVMPT